jgi:hypothetical protein
MVQQKPSWASYGWQTCPGRSLFMNYVPFTKINIIS